MCSVGCFSGGCAGTAHATRVAEAILGCCSIPARPEPSNCGFTLERRAQAAFDGVEGISGESERAFDGVEGISGESGKAFDGVEGLF